MDQNRIFERLAAFEGWLHENGRAMGTREKYLRDVRAFADWANGRPLTRELALAMLAAVNSFLRFDVRFSLRRSAEGQLILCQVNGQPHEIVAACNIKCERTNTTSNDGYAFYRIYFFTIKSPKAQGGRENEARFF